MIVRTIEFMPGAKLECWLNDLPVNPRDAILIIPGGGYGHVCADREGQPPALAFFLQNMQAFVLHYSVGGAITRPTLPLEQAAAAMIYIREHARELGVSGRVYAAGFSAGGHLAGWLGTCAESVTASPLARPDGLILCYAVIAEFREKVKETSFNALFRKDELTKEELESVELHRHVSGSTPPVFMVHSYDDRRVPVENALCMADACAKAGVPFELHIYPHAAHGSALGTPVTSQGKSDMENPQMSRWVQDAAVWMKGL